MEHTGTSNYETVDQFLFACDKNHNFRHAFPVTNALFDLKKKNILKAQVLKVSHQINGFNRKILEYHLLKRLL